MNTNVKRRPAPSIEHTARVFRSPGSYVAATGAVGIVYCMYWMLALVVLLPYWSGLGLWYVCKYTAIFYWWVAVWTWKISVILYRLGMYYYNRHMVR